MADNRKGMFVGIAVIAIMSVAAVLYFSRIPAVPDDATGAIGAAERYRAEQITDADVILDIPGQEEFAEAVFEALTDEQKAELVSGMDEAGRNALYAKFNDAAAFARMDPVDQGRYVKALNPEAQERIADLMRFDEGDLSRIGEDALGRGVLNFTASRREEFFGRFDATTALSKMDSTQMAHFARASDAAAQERIAALMKFKEADLGSISEMDLARGIDNMDAKAKAQAFSEFNAKDVFARGDSEQMAHFALAADWATQQRIANAAKFDAADLALMKFEDLANKLATVDANARAEAVGQFEAREALAQMDSLQLARLALAAKPAVQQRIAADLKFSRADLSRVSDATLARGIANIKTEARAEAFGQFDVRTVLNRADPHQLAQFTLANERAVQKRIADAMRLTGPDLARVETHYLGNAVAALDSEARLNAFSKSAASEAAFQRMADNQRAAFANALGAKAFETAMLQAKMFSRLSESQQRQVWARAGSVGQMAALRYSGFEADLGRGGPVEREAGFERYLSERSSQHNATER